MKTRTAPFTFAILSAFTLLLASACLAFSQGFANLDFESAQVIPLTQGADYPPYSIATTNALPGWAVYLGSSQQSQITDTPALGSTWVFLIATNGALSGNFSVGLQGGSTYSSASISQTGLVPVGTESLQFEAQSSLAAIPGSLVVSLGGQNILFSALSADSNYTLYGGNISPAFAGQTETLTFSALESIYGANNWDIDNIQFSSIPTPEPSTVGLFALGGLLLGYRRWRQSPRS